MSPIDIPARFRTVFTASIGPTPMISGSMPETAVAMMRAIGEISSWRARSSLMITTAAAPSFSGHALPAVTLPSGLNAGLSSASFSSVVPARGPSSLETTVPSVFVYGEISLSKKPRSWAATARSCDRLANLSISSRDTLKRSATFSAVMPIGM